MMKRDYTPILQYFAQHPFGTEMPVLTLLSTLPPVDRVEILSTLLEDDPTSTELYNKLSMAFLKDGDPNRAHALIEHGLETGALDAYTHSQLSQKLETIAVGVAQMKEQEAALQAAGIEIPRSPTSLAQTSEILSTKFSSVDLHGGEVFRDLLLDFCTEND